MQSAPAHESSSGVAWLLALLVALAALAVSAASAWSAETFPLPDPSLSGAEFAALAGGDFSPLLPKSPGDLPRVVRWLVFLPETVGAVGPVFSHALSLLLALAWGLVFWRFLSAVFVNEWVGLMAMALCLVHPVLAESAVMVVSRPQLLSMLLATAVMLRAVRQWQRGRPCGALVFLGAVLAVLLNPLASALPLLLLGAWWLCAKLGHIRAGARCLITILSLLLVIAALQVLAHFAGGSAPFNSQGAFAGPGVHALLHAARQLLECFWPWPLVVHGLVLPSGMAEMRAWALLLLVALLLGVFARTRPAFTAGLALLCAALLPVLLGATEPAPGFASRHGLFLLLGLGVLFGALCAGLATRTRIMAVLLGAMVLVPLTWLHSSSLCDRETLLRVGAVHEPQDPWYALQRALLPTSASESADVKAREADLRLALGLAVAANDSATALRAEALLAELLLRAGKTTESATCIANVLSRGGEDEQLWQAAGLELRGMRRRQVEVLLSAGEESQAVAATEALLQGSVEAADQSLAGRIRLRHAIQEWNSAAGEEQFRALRLRIEAALDLLARAAESADVEVAAPALLARGEGLLRAEWIPQYLALAQGVQTELAARFPERAEPLLLSSELRSLGGDRPGALRDLLLALERNVRDLPLFARAARELMAVGENRRAVAVLRLGLRVDGTSSVLRTLLAEILLAQGRQSQGAGDHARALRAAEEALQLLPDVAEAEALRGDALMSLGRFETAEPALKRALEIAPDLSDARRGMARFLQARGLGALADIQRVLKAMPAETRAAHEQSIRDRVLADFRRALELGGDWSELALARRHVLNAEESDKRAAAEDLIQRGKSELKLGNATAARELARQAVRVHGALPSASLLLARTELACGDGTAALGALETVLQFEPDSLEALLAAAQIEAAGSKLTAARRHAQRFLELTAGDGAAEFEAERALLQQLLDGKL
jgi:tetratricopeptide (TPR) repeat protein